MPMPPTSAASRKHGLASSSCCMSLRKLIRFTEIMPQRPDWLAGVGGFRTSAWRNQNPINSRVPSILIPLRARGDRYPFPTAFCALDGEVRCEAAGQSGTGCP